MKNSLTVTVFPKLKNLILLLTLFLFSTGCDEILSDANSEENTEAVAKVATPADNIHVAFAGGGWRAHTAHTAWTMSLLENNGNKLDNVFKNVESIGSNSGGSWFSTMLMYSPQFVTDIEKPGAIKTWADPNNNNAWLGRQQTLFSKATAVDSGISCDHLSGTAYTSCVISYYSGLELEWNEVIKSLVFKDYSLGSLKLDGARQPWAKGKSLLIASTMLTNNVVLNAEGGVSGRKYTQYYQACLNDKVNLHGKNGGTCNNGVVPDVTPVTFSSIPTSGLTAPYFFPEAGTSKEFHIGYSQLTDDNPNTDSIIIKKAIISDQTEIMHAAAASSAAVGFAASKNISGGWYTSYQADNSALNFSLQNGIAKYDVAKNGTSIKDLASSVRVSLADGGPVDNSGVAQLMSFLQLNNKDTNFHIVAFDNVQGPPYVPGENGAAVGSDLASLLGRDLCLEGKFCTGYNCDGVCVTVPELQIFESTPIENALTWSYPKKPSKYKNAPRLLYTRYKVTTTANSTFGIKAGSSGYLHAFTCYYPDAPTAPQNETKNGSFIAYNDMMQFINDGLTANNNEGLTLLEKAMGL